MPMSERGVFLTHSPGQDRGFGDSPDRLLELADAGVIPLHVYHIQHMGFLRYLVEGVADAV